MNITSVAISTAAAAGVGVAAAATPTDLGDLAKIIIALATLVTSMGAVVISIMTKRETALARASADAANEQAKATAKAVDGKMTEVVALVRKEATSEGKLFEQAAQRDREGAAATAVLKEKERAPVVTPAVVAESLSPSKEASE